jgi:hypothetical protein
VRPVEEAAEGDGLVAGDGEELEKRGLGFGFAWKEGGRFLFEGRMRRGTLTSSAICLNERLERGGEREEVFRLCVPESEGHVSERSALVYRDSGQTAGRKSNRQHDCERRP